MCATVLLREQRQDTILSPGVLVEKSSPYTQSHLLQPGAPIRAVGCGSGSLQVGPGLLIQAVSDGCRQVTVIGQVWIGTDQRLGLSPG